MVGTNGVEGAVNPGTYQLTESPKDLGATTGYYQFGTWTCEGDNLHIGATVTADYHRKPGDRGRHRAV